MRYELRIARNSAREALRRKRDAVPILLGVPLLLAAAVQWLRGGVPEGTHMSWTMLAAGAVLGAVVGTAIERRLEHLRQHSVVAALALQRGEGLGYRLQWHGPVLLLWAGIAALLGGWELLAGSGYAVVALTVPLALPALARWRKLVRRPAPIATSRARARAWAVARGARVRQLLVRRAAFLAAPALTNILFCAAAGGAAALPYALIGTPAAAFASAAALFLLLVRPARQHPPLWRYLLFHGVPPLAASLAPGALAAATLAGFSLAVGLTGTAPWLPAIGAATATLALFLALAGLRAGHLATKRRGMADLAFQFDLMGVAIASLLILPLTPLLVLARIVQLELQARSARYLLP